MRICTVLIPLILALCAQAAPALEFEIRLGDQLLGREELESRVSGDTLIVESRSEWISPAQELDARTRLILPGLDFVDYRLVSNLGDTIAARREGGEIIMDITGRIQQSQRFEFTGAIPLPLDNGLAQHLWILARHLHERGPEENLLVLVPQVFYSGPIEWRDSQSLTGHLGGAPLAIRRQALALAGLRTELDIDDGGELLSAWVPMQSFEIRRTDYLPPRPAVLGESPFRCIELEVNGGGPALGATLTLPEGEGPFPAAIFLHGSGPNDRDETLGPNHLFRELADSLAARGIASLRYDKRTWVMNRDGLDHSEEYAALTLREEVVEDALAAFGLLLERPELDPDRCFVLGHSLGAMMAPRVSRLLAGAGTPARGLVLLAPGARDLLDLSADQFLYLHELGQIPREQLDISLEALGRVRAGKLEPGEKALGAGAVYWESVLFLDPRREFLAQDAPALLLFGERDYQVPETERLLWKEALVDGAPKGTELVVLPGLNHFFHRGEGPPSPEEYGRAGSVEAGTMDRVAEWMENVVREDVLRDE